MIKGENINKVRKILKEWVDKGLSFLVTAIYLGIIPSLLAFCLIARITVILTNSLYYALIAGLFLSVSSELSWIYSLSWTHSLLIIPIINNKKEP